MINVEPHEVPKDAQLIDIREDFEWNTEHAQGATHIPLGELTERLGELNPDQDIYLICHAGGRSARAAQYLEQAMGWEIHNVLGGTDAWIAQGLPTVYPSEL